MHKFSTIVLTLLCFGCAQPGGAREFGTGRPGLGATGSGGGNAQSTTATLSAPPQEPVVNTETMPSSFAKTWDAVVATVTDQELPIQAIEKASGVLTTDFVTSGRDYSGARLYRISSVARMWYWTGVRYKVSVLVTASGDSSTAVRVTSHIEGFAYGTYGGWAVCPSNGVLEREIFSAVKSRL